MDTTLNIDVGTIIAALAPTIAILATAWVAWRTAEKNATSHDRQLGDIHTLVNDQMTKEKQARLDILRANRVVLARLVRDEARPDEVEVLGALDAQIAGLEREIVHRGETASTIDERNAPPQGS